MASLTEDRYRDLMPPPGWQPKSAFFRSIWAKAAFKRSHPRLTLACPCCGEEFTVEMSLLDPGKPLT